MDPMPYAHVPEPDEGSEPDPHWLELRRTPWRLPESYMPPAMAGPKPWWARAAAWLLVGLFLGATVLGVCLTYGPGA